jgi:hypothetical protein
MRSKSSGETFTGAIPAWRLISEVWESSSHEEINFSIRVISLMAMSMYSLASALDSATTVISKRDPMSLTTRFCISWACALQEIRTRKKMSHLILLGFECIEDIDVLLDGDWLIARCP